MTHKGKAQVRHGRIIWEGRWESYVIRISNNGFMASDNGDFGNIIARFQTRHAAIAYARKYGYAV